ncbi:hypothetical protein KC318_g9333 [Hortaea werneckii]|nr:hypothetical protein KC334_g15543 [Hortaea werneckii]KAI6928418.1 hypothetical protein KC355_g16549 [Hortaea werneckii]KAI7661634.1 hypothetical protein KC318_g9333 [Hortaea werneckii]
MQLLTVAATFFATYAVAAHDVVALADIQARDEFQPDPIIGLADIQPRDEFQPTADSLNSLYMTNDISWAGEGQNLCNLSGYCSNSLPDGLAKNVSSAGPEQGMTCFLYDGENCTGIQSLPIVHPGYANLDAIDFNNRALSWKCWKYCGFMGASSSAVPSSTSSGGSSSENPNDVTHSLTVPGVPITSTAVFSEPRPTSTSIVTITSTVRGPAPYTR